MASHEKVTPLLLPDTLPEDFGEWDGEASAPPPRNTSEWDTAFDSGETKKPHGQSDDRDAYLASLMDKQRLSRSASSAPGFAKQSDFVNWEREAPSAPLRDKSRVREGAPARSEPAKPPANVRSEPAKPLGHSPALDRPSDAWPAVSEPVFAKPQAPHRPEASHTKDEAAVASSWPNAAPVDGVSPSRELTATEMRKADETLYQMFSSKNPEVKGKGKPAKKKWVIFAAAGVCAILLPLIVVVSLGHHGAKTVAKPAVQPFSMASDTAPQTNAPADVDASALGKPQTAKKPADDQTASDGNAANSGNGLTSKQAKAMNDQLNAPRVISQDARKQLAENAPPPASLGVDGLGGSAMESVFNGHAQSNVKVTSSKPIGVSSGVANGMLIQKTAPVYPPMAKTARVSGTVELHATISKTGTIKELYVVSGPTMLRQAAIDAVRNWRYRPYTLNDEPTEMETTINVVFSLGG